MSGDNELNEACPLKMFLQVISSSKLWFNEFFFKDSYIQLCGVTLSDPYIAQDTIAWKYLL